MVRSPQTHSPSRTRHVTASATMSYEKQSGIPKRRPVQNTTTQSPKWAGRVNTLQSLVGTTGINGWTGHRRDGVVEGVGAEARSVDDSIPTPVTPFLSPNITPRSGSRKARAETASPTPNGTLNGTQSISRPVSSVEKHDVPTEDARATSGLGLRIANTGKRSRTGSVISDGPGSSISSKSILMERSSSSSIASPDNAPKFFHADDVKASIPSRPTSERSHPQGRLPGHVQPKDENIPFVRTCSFGNGSATDEQRPKFFYANDANESKSPPLRLANGNPSNRPPLQTIHSAQNGNSPPRAPSPLKEEIIPQKPLGSKPSPRRHTRLVSNGGSGLPSPQAITRDNGDLSRRASLKSPKQPSTASHARSTSVNSGPSPPRKTGVGLSDPASGQRTRTTSLGGANGALPDSVNPHAISQELPQSRVLSPPQSPTKAPGVSQSKIDHMVEFATNARRERKVLDLEISNSSLLAINRTLEREMRKQTAELRRFRRLSRSGRLSVAPSRSASGKMSMLSEATEETDDLSLSDSDEEEDDMEDIFSNLSSKSAASGPSSPTTRAAHDRFHDPKRIELDLAAHRALLLDSQKLNFSIKRCLSQSESLLESGKRALAHRAEAPEPEKLGRRVLTPDEVEDGLFSQGQGLLSPSLNHAMGNPWERSLGGLGGLNAGLEMPDRSKWQSQSVVETSFADLIEEEIPRPPNESTTIGTLVPESEADAFSAEATLESDNVLPKLNIGERYKGLEANNMLLRPGLSERRASSILSLDGLDDQPKTSAPTKSNNTKALPKNPSEEAVDPASFVARAGRGERMRSGDPKPGEAGFRGSMQGLGHYLQTFSLFGPSQQA